MIPTEFYIILFNSTHHAIKTEKRLKQAGVKIEMIPTPRDITISCGLSIKFSANMLNKVKEIVYTDEIIFKLYKGIKYDEGIVYLEEE